MAHLAVIGAPEYLEKQMVSRLKQLQEVPTVFEKFCSIFELPLKGGMVSLEVLSSLSAGQKHLTLCHKRIVDINKIKIESQFQFQESNQHQQES